VGKRGFTPAPNHEETVMKSNSLIGLLALAGFSAGFSLSPAWAQHEGHQHGQSEATPASREAGEASGKAADKPTPNDLKAGGKTCKKCGKSMGGGGGGMIMAPPGRTTTTPPPAPRSKPCGPAYTSWRSAST
jgi:hypothetical protein